MRRLFNVTFYSEDGIYYNDTENALGVFKNQFNVNNIDINEGKNTFRKLMKEYSHDESEVGDWSNKIIDKETLVGQNQLSTDVIINVSTDEDTGLYELYNNVVKVFIDAMIAEAYSYTNDNTSFKGRSGMDRVGVSYSYGSNDNLIEYGNVATNKTYAPYPYPTGVPYDTYRGDVGTVDSGKQYAGLKQDEKSVWDSYFNTVSCDQITDHKFYSQYWAGIDCSGFVQRVINAADPIITSDNGVPPVVIKVDNLDDYSIVCNTSGRYLAKRTWVGYYFDYFSDYRVTKYLALPTSGSDRERLLKLIKKGDLMRYSGHISIVYSKKWGESEYINTLGTLYDIIHAYGGGATGYYNENIPGKASIFARKVIVTGSNIANPSGFGRIKLWE
jgi:hypothetical protein